MNIVKYFNFRKFHDIIVFIIISSFGIYIVSDDLLKIVDYIPSIDTNTIPVPFVFTSKDDTYSMLLGGSIKVTATDKNNTIVDIDLDKYGSSFNHSFAKLITNIVTNPTKYKDENNTVYSNKHLAIKQVFCQNESYQTITITRNFVMQNEMKHRKTFRTTILCN